MSLNVTSLLFISQCRHHCIQQDVFILMYRTEEFTHRQNSNASRTKRPNSVTVPQRQAGRVKKAISFLFANDMHGALSQVVNKLKSKTTLRRSVSNAPEGTEFLPLLTRQQYQAYFPVCNSDWQSGSAASLGHETSAGQRKGRGFPSNIYLQPAIIG